MSSNKGFLLIEALISVVVITTALVVIVRSLSVVTRAIRIQDRYLEASFLLQARQWEVAHQPKLSVGESSGTFEGESPFRWTQRVDQLTPLNLMQVELAIQWQDFGQHRDLTTVFLLPAP